MRCLRGKRAVKNRVMIIFLFFFSATRWTCFLLLKRQLRSDNNSGGGGSVSQRCQWQQWRSSDCAKYSKGRKIMSGKKTMYLKMRRNPKRNIYRGAIHSFASHKRRILMLKLYSTLRPSTIFISHIFYCCCVYVRSPKRLLNTKIIENHIITVDFSLSKFYGTHFSGLVFSKRIYIFGDYGKFISRLCCFSDNQFTIKNRREKAFRTKSENRNNVSALSHVCVCVCLCWCIDIAPDTWR